MLPVHEHEKEKRNKRIGYNNISEQCMHGRVIVVVVQVVVVAVVVC